MDTQFNRSPYEVLGISKDANFKDIRKKYKQLIRQFPPESNPEKFTQINTAYREITGKNPAKKENNYLYRFPLTFVEDKMKQAKNKQKPLHPLSVVPESIFSIEQQIKELLK